jgi:hypothetical protein
MASITKVSGGSQPVFASDTLNGFNSDVQNPASANYAPAGVPTQLAGPKLQFFGADLGGNPFAQAGQGGAIQALLQALQEKCTVAVYQVQNSAAANNFSIGIYPVGAFNTATDGTDNSTTNLVALTDALGTVNGYNFASPGSAYTNIGFKLAAS